MDQEFSSLCFTVVVESASSGSGSSGTKNMLWNKYYFTTLVMGWSSETLDSNNPLWLSMLEPRPNIIWTELSHDFLPPDFA